MSRVAKSPRILLIDIETFPMLMYAWQAWEASALRIVADTSICSFSAKWLGERQIITKAICDYPGYKPGSRDDKRLLKDLWALLNEADIVGAHNLDRFDDKKITYRFMVHEMPPPSPYKHLDTLKELKKVSSWDSHKLNEVCRVRSIGRKVRTGGADLWFDCLAGDPKAWARMKKYNAHDVRLLEPVYLFLRPWIRNHPNVGMHTEDVVCPKCGSGDLSQRGFAFNATTQYQRYRCRDCGGWARGAKNVRKGKPLVNA